VTKGTNETTQVHEGGAVQEGQILYVGLLHSFNLPWQRAHKYSIRLSAEQADSVFDSWVI
jgi:hypothetical protein